jgi:hypothetical protein
MWSLHETVPSRIFANAFQNRMTCMLHFDDLEVFIVSVWIWKYYRSTIFWFHSGLLDTIASSMIFQDGRGWRRSGRGRWIRNRRRSSTFDGCVAVDHAFPSGFAGDTDANFAQGQATHLSPGFVGIRCGGYHHLKGWWYHRYRSTGLCQVVARFCGNGRRIFAAGHVLVMVVVFRNRAHLDCGTVDKARIPLDDPRWMLLLEYLCVWANGVVDVWRHDRHDSPRTKNVFQLSTLSIRLHYSTGLVVSFFRGKCNNSVQDSLLLEHLMAD